MPPLPTRKQSRARKGFRGSHFKRPTANVSPCPRCHNAKISHRICPTCGYYKGREVMPVDKQD